jgi:ABC-type nitrate/sulfonate/bicarbonate transport system permease component
MAARKKKTLYKYLAFYLFLWIILFEFILPVNKIFPKPSIVIQSFPSLLSDYNLLPNYISTIAVIYIALVSAYYFVKLLGFLPGKENKLAVNFIFSLEWFSEYIPGIILGLLLIFWFPSSEYIEFIFAFLSAFFYMMIVMQKSRSFIPEEYITVSGSIDPGGKVISKMIYWKFAQAEIVSRLEKIHFNLWLVLIAFEYIKGGYGIGNVFHRALIYNDLSAFFSALIITGLTIYIGSLAIKYIQNKILFWK